MPRLVTAPWPLDSRDIDAPRRPFERRICGMHRIAGHCVFIVVKPAICIGPARTAVPVSAVFIPTHPARETVSGHLKFRSTCLHSIIGRRLVVRKQGRRRHLIVTGRQALVAPPARPGAARRARVRKTETSGLWRWGR